MTDWQSEQQATTGAELRPELDPETLDSDQRKGLTLMEEICAASGLAARAVVRSARKPYLEIELIGDDVAMTIGRLGQSLDALQFLCNLILSRRVEGDVRLLLDAADYRARRTEALRRKAIELADEVRARNEEAELEPLPAHERRIIHSVLADYPGIQTYSEGDEPDRRVVISPRH